MPQINTMFQIIFSTSFNIPYLYKNKDKQLLKVFIHKIDNNILRLYSSGKCLLYIKDYHENNENIYIESFLNYLKEYTNNFDIKIVTKSFIRISTTFSINKQLNLNKIEEIFNINGIKNSNLYYHYHLDIRKVLYFINDKRDGICTTFDKRCHCINKCRNAMISINGNGNISINGGFISLHEMTQFNKYLYSFIWNI